MGYNERMTKNPFINAFAAALYIAGVASLMYYAPKVEVNGGVIMPLTVLSLLVLSVLTLGYLFFAQPIQLYLDGEKKEAVTLFIKTAGVFAGITAVFLFTLLFVLSK